MRLGMALVVGMALVGDILLADIVMASATMTLASVPLAVATMAVATMASVPTTLPTIPMSRLVVSQHPNRSQLPMLWIVPLVRKS
jgi:hypothetical protein